MPRRSPFTTQVAGWSTAVLLAACSATGDAGDEGAGNEAATGVEAEVAATVTFPEPVSDSAAVAFLRTHSLRPYAVHLVAGGVTAVHEVPRGEAALEVIDRAREEGSVRLTQNVCAQQGRAAAALERAGADGTDRVEAARRVVSDLTRLERGLARIPRGDPVVRALRVVGTPGDVESAAGAGTATVLRADGDADEPPAPEHPVGATAVLPEVAELSDAAVLERARALADRGLTDCHDVARGR